ncbi:MAG: hypothetical protein K6G27_07760 [Lachnospiraceae bacterium]|nr:hypothetical protein [Lachnospiraceae bacterium]
MDKRYIFDFLGTSTEMNNLSEAERKLHERRRIIRVASVVLVIVCTLFLAVAAGTMIALWDSGKTAKELFEVMNGTYVYAKTQDELARLKYEAEAAADEDKKDVADNVAMSVVNEVAGAGEEVSGEGALDYAGDNAEGTADNGTAEDVQDDQAGLEQDDTTDNVENVSADDTDAALMEAEGVNEYVDPDVNYPIPFTTVDESYFNDALFIGDSRLQGFGMYSGLPGTFYAATGFQLYKYDTMKVVNTDAGKVPIVNAMPYDTFSKVYIKVGLNEVGGNENVFRNKYAELIQMIRDAEPRAIIYVHGILPVTAAKSQSDKTHSNANVTKRNEMLKQIALEERAYYLDVGSVFMGADGFLPPEMAADGIHLKAQYMDKWKQYLLEHAIVVQ